MQNEPFCDIKYFLSRIENYNGPEKELIQNLPQLYAIIRDILNDRYCDWYSRVILSSALGYLILEEDVIPDYKELGYLDDLYILSFALREISRNISPEVIISKYNGNEDIIQIIEELTDKCHEILGDKACSILNLVGLLKLRSLEIEFYSGTYPERLAQIATEKRELLGIVAYLTKVLFNQNIKGRKLKDAIEFMKKTPDYSEIERIIDLSMDNHHIGKKEKSGTDIDEIIKEWKYQQLLKN